MKDWLSVQDYLFTPADVGDWDGEEELVADRLNELLHLTWDMIPEDCNSEQVDQIMKSIWDTVRGDIALVEAEMDELIDWCVQHVTNLIEEQSEE